MVERLGPRGRWSALSRRQRMLLLGVLAAMAIIVVGVAFVLTRPAPAVGSLEADAQLMAALQRLRSASSSPAVVFMEDGFPKAVQTRVPVEGATPVDRARDYLRDYADLYRLAGSDSGLGVRRSAALEDGVGDAVTFYQSYRGVPVYGAEIVIPLDGSEALGSIGKLRPDLALGTTPTIAAQAAEGVARGLVGDVPLSGRTKLVVFDPSLLGIPGGTDDAAARLAWRVLVGGVTPEESFVDATTGAPIARLERSPQIFTIHVTTLGEALPASEAGCIYEGGEANGGDADAAEVTANFEATYDWYVSSFGRDSYNGLSAPIHAIVHVGFRDGDGMLTQNARWATGCDAFEFATATVDAETVTHEFQHAVTEYRAGLVYFGTAGALNESFSDVMAFLQSGDPVLFEATGAFTRDVSQPAHATSFSLGDIGADLKYPDHGRVHKNSAIPNNIAYLIARGDVEPGIGDAMTAKLYFLALGMHGPSSDFDQHRSAIETAAIMLELPEGDRCQIGRRFTQAGIGWDGPGCHGVFPDGDEDGVDDALDNCDDVPNPLQENLDRHVDDLGDACDDDDDGDGRPDTGPPLVADNCPRNPNPLQEDLNSNGIGTACDPSEDGDIDNDHVPDAVDNCPHDYNLRPQPDRDRDGEGDACDPDLDGDGIGTNDDNCPDVANADQGDADGDGIGDACDGCQTVADGGTAWTSIDYFNEDGDYVTEIGPVIADSDGDGIGDACDRDSVGTREAVARAREGGVGIRPDADGTDLVVSGEPSDQVAIAIALCELVCEPVPPVDACVDVRMTDGGPGLRAYVRDDLGGAVGRIGADERLQFVPSGGRSYELVFAFAEAVIEDDVRVMTGRCDPGTPDSPTVTPTPTVSQPTPGTSFVPTTGGEITLETTSGSVTVQAQCEIAEFPADLGGGFGFSVQGTEQRPDGGLNYIALVVDITDPADPDGTYDRADGFGTVTLGEDGFNLGQLSITVRDDGAGGIYSGTNASTQEAVSGSFRCR